MACVVYSHAMYIHGVCELQAFYMVDGAIREGLYLKHRVAQSHHTNGVSVSIEGGGVYMSYLDVSWEGFKGLFWEFLMSHQGVPVVTLDEDDVYDVISMCVHDDVPKRLSHLPEVYGVKRDLIRRDVNTLPCTIKGRCILYHHLWRDARSTSMEGS